MDNASREPRHKTRTWIWHFDSPLELIWPVLSDTARFDEAAALLGKAVREHDGAIVKTIGDAIMAAYVNPANGLRCAADPGEINGIP